MKIRVWRWSFVILLHTSSTMAPSQILRVLDIVLSLPSQALHEDGFVVNPQAIPVEFLAIVLNCHSQHLITAPCPLPLPTLGSCKFFSQNLGRVGRTRVSVIPWQIGTEGRGRAELPL